jgi:tRNA (guanosine-2'-O-)-methyltransferase
MTEEKRLQRIENTLRHKQPILQVFLDDVHSSQNLSAIIRSCDGVGVLDLYYHTSDNRDLRIHKTITQGAHRWVNRTRVDTEERTVFLKKKQKEGYQVVVTHLSAKAVSYQSLDYTKPTVFVLGNEKDGVSDDVIALADEVIIIPMRGMVQSLNVSVATALLLYEAQRQLQISGSYDVPQLSLEEQTKIKNEWIFRDTIVRRSKGKFSL